MLIVWRIKFFYVLIFIHENKGRIYNNKKSNLSFPIRIFRILKSLVREIGNSSQFC